MTVYIDDFLFPAKVGRLNAKWSHLMTDAEDIYELHAFALRIGLKRSWFQDANGALPHYDVTESVRRKAIECGAVEVSYFEIGRRCLRCPHCGRRRSAVHDLGDCRKESKNV